MLQMLREYTETNNLQIALAFMLQMLREYILILAESILHKTCINYNMAFVTKKNY